MKSRENGNRLELGRPALLLPMLAVAALVGLAPFAAALRGSFLHDFYGDISPAGLENYRFILGDRAFGYSLNITVLWASLQTLFTVSLGLVTAYRLWRPGRGLSGRQRLERAISGRAGAAGGSGIPGRRSRTVRPIGNFRPLYLAVLVPWGVPVYIAVPIWRALIHGDGVPFNLLLQPFWAFFFALLVSVWLSLPATVFIFYSGLKKIGRHVVEAASIDGADETSIAVSICLPQLRQIILSVVLINFVKALKEFSVVFLMTAGGPPLVSGITERYIVGATTTLSVFLYDLFLSAGDYGVSSAFSVLLSAVILTATLIYLAGRSHDNRRLKRSLILLPAAVQLMTGGPAAVSVALLYLAVFVFNSRLSAVIILHTVVMIVLLVVQGFPAGLQPALAAAFAVWIVRSGRSRLLSTGPGRNIGIPGRVLWRGASGAVPVVLVMGAAVMGAALLWLSFSGVDAVTFNSVLPPKAGLRAYRLAIGEEHIFRYFANTFVVAMSTALLLPLITFPASWVIAGGKARTGAFILVSIQLIGTVSGMHALIPLYIIFRSLGIINTYASLILIYLEHSFVFSLYTMSAFLRDLPSSLREAAVLEGAGPLYYLRKILLPLSRPVIFTAMIVTFLGAWNGFLPALLFIRDDWKYTIGVKIYTFVGSIASGSPRWSLFAATSVMNLLFLVVLFGVMIRRGGVTALSDVEE